MEIDFLRHFGFKSEHIAVLRKAYGDDLLPLQERVIQEGRLFEGESLLICAPTSAGKTFLAEALFLHHALQGRNAVLLAPTKALASQRYQEWRERYQPLGYRVLLSTRDHAIDDESIRSGDFHLAVVIYEKMRALLQNGAALANTLGACLADEIHYLYDPRRGPAIETLLTRLRQRESLQMVGLSAMVKDPRAAEWLGARLIEEDRRPVELRQGVLCQGTFSYRNFNDGEEGVEKFPLPPDGDEGEAMLSAAKYFAERGETTLLFWPRRDLCYTAAKRLAQCYDPDESVKPPQDLRLEPTAMSSLLREILPRRIAVHTSDLTPDERTWVERAARSGEAAIICATSTLAEGVNFPVVNALTTRRMYASQPEDLQAKRPPAPAPIPPDRLMNMIGRAGRLGHSEFGRGMVVAASPGDVDGLHHLYTKTPPDISPPVLHRYPIESVLLSCVALQGDFTGDSLVDFLHATLSGRWGLWPGDLENKIKQTLRRFTEDGLVNEEYGSYALTPLGKAVAAGGLSLETALKMRDFIREYWTSSPPEAALLLRVCLSTEIDETYVAVSRGELAAHDWPNAIHQWVEEAGVSTHPFIQALLARPERLTESHHRAMKKALLIHQWCDGASMTELEQAFKIHAGAIQRLGEEAAWLLGVLADAAAAFAQPPESIRQTRTLREQALYGLKARNMGWAGFLRRGLLTRREIHQLDSMEYHAPAAVHGADEDYLKRFLPKAAVEAIMASARTPLEDATQRESNDFVIQFDMARPHLIALNGHDIELTRLQAGLLRCLARRAGVCVSYDVMLDEIWPGAASERKQISRLKNQIIEKAGKALGAKPASLIQTTPGEGMALVARVEGLNELPS